MRLTPQICGEWDGCAVWLQWTPLEENHETDYQIELHQRRSPDEEWSDWMQVVPRQGTKSHWAVIPTWKENWQFQARVRALPAEGDDVGWEYATEVTFARCTCQFTIESSKYDQHFGRGTVFTSQVDGAACAYQLTEEIEVEAGATAQTQMESVGASGYHQLDYPKHFEIKPSLGCVVYNSAPSENDVTPSGRDFTEIKPRPLSDPIVMAVGKPNRF